MNVYIWMSVQHVVSLPGPPVIRSVASGLACSPQKKEALKTDRHSNTGSIYNNPPLTDIWSLVPSQEMTHLQQYKVSWWRLLVGEQEQFDLFPTALLS